MHMHLCSHLCQQLASAPGPLFVFGFERAWYAKIRHACYVILDQRGCVHGDTSFHHDIVPECLWPSSSLVRVLEYSETDDRIAS